MQNNRNLKNKILNLSVKSSKSNKEKVALHFIASNYGSLSLSSPPTIYLSAINPVCYDYEYKYYLFILLFNFNQSLYIYVSTLCCMEFKKNSYDKWLYTGCVSFDVYILSVASSGR